MPAKVKPHRGVQFQGLRISEKAFDVLSQLGPVFQLLPRSVFREYRTPDALVRAGLVELRDLGGKYYQARLTVAGTEFRDGVLRARAARLDRALGYFRRSAKVKRKDRV